MSIKQRRMEKGWTQEDLARHAGLSARTIQRVENGKNVGVESLKCLAAVFEMPVNSLVQEQKMSDLNSSDKSRQVKLSDAEKQAIQYGKSLINTPRTDQLDPLTPIERKAINFGKKLLEKIKM